MSKYVCPVCRNREHFVGAKFCMICGTPIKSCAGCVNEAAERDQDCCWNCNRNRKKNRRDLYRPMPEKGDEP